MSLPSEDWLNHHLQITRDIGTLDVWYLRPNPLRIGCIEFYHASTKEEFEYLQECYAKHYSADTSGVVKLHLT